MYEKRSCLLAVFFLMILGISMEHVLAQVVYTPLSSGIYNYLDRLAAKGVIQYNDEVLPMPRVEIAKYLRTIAGARPQLSAVEKDELSFYEQEYFKELDSVDVKERWFLFSYKDSTFALTCSPIAGYELNSVASKPGHARWWGGRFYCTYSNYFSATLDFRDKGEFGDNVNETKENTPLTGYYINAKPSNGIEYSDVNGGITLNWNWGSVSLIKDYFRWGHGDFGNLIFSTKAPSYPSLRLYLEPTKWLRFYYFHGWLTSNVPDSINYYPTEIKRDGVPVLRKRYKDKFVAANFLSISPMPSLDISIGNSVVYSDVSIHPEYLIPFLIFKFLDHNMGRDNDYGNNGQMFLDLALRYPECYKFYGTFFLDATEIRNVLKGDFSNTWYGVTLGMRRFDCVLENLDLAIEFTHISPWVYEHYIPTVTYKHMDNSLGHWIGQNADQLRLQVDYQVSRGLKFSLYGERYRKGGLKNIYFAYETEEYEPFLYGPVRRDISGGLTASYEIAHDLFAKFTYQYSYITDEDKTRTPQFQLGVTHSFAVSLYYGL